MEGFHGRPFLVYNNATIILSLEYKMVYEKLEGISVFFLLTEMC